MNAKQQEFLLQGGASTQTDELIRLLHDAAGEWVPLPMLVDAIGSYCIHSRAADARKLGVNIENKVEFSPITKKRHSFYRLLAP